ncbi:unnamed protein product [Taenia asiatica]|uniref:F-box domain-containing protein n=1 Tax=Taenia asiatica TaxID=60517 RepID=A0A0R3WD28_TAEAS|nr:unnamed protein product [Taenia asiatica]
MSMMERLPPTVQIEICEYLDGADIVSVCEAVPNMKSFLNNLTIKGIQRKIHGNPSKFDKCFHYLAFKFGTDAAELTSSFGDTIKRWTNERGQRLYEKSFIHCARTDACDSDEEERQQDCVLIDTHTIRQFHS